MGFVIRKEGKLFVRKDNFQIIKDKNKAKELLIKNLAIKRKDYRIIIYKELDFEEFYKKHCERIPNNDKSFTVIVENDIKIPNKDTIRKFIEDALSGRILINEDPFIIEIPEHLFGVKLKVKTIENGKFLTESCKGRFRFRDIKDISKIDENLNRRDILTKDDFNNLNNYWEVSFTAESDYSIKKILLIDHIDVVI